MVIVPWLLAVALGAPTPADYTAASRLAQTLACRATLADAWKVMAPAGEPEVKVVDTMTFVTWDRAPAKDGAVCSVSLSFADGRLTAVVDACVAPPDFAERFVYKRYCE
jgi:hypothetical protein